MKKEADTISEAFRKRTAHLRGKNIHVVGIAGAEGSAVLEFLVDRVGCDRVTAHDQHERKEFVKWFRKAHMGMSDVDSREAAERVLGCDDVTYRFSRDYLAGVEDADLLFVPQSWYLYPENDCLKVLTGKFSSLMRLYFDLFPGRIVGVTGSNGKTTTANMIFSVLSLATEVDDDFTGQVFFSGNDRRSEQMLSVLDRCSKDDWLVLEISNRHLKMDLGRSPDISVITNISPNHLLEHVSFADYKACKESLLQYQTESQVAVLNEDDAESRQLMKRNDKEWIGFSVVDHLGRGSFVQNGQMVLKHGDVTEVVCSVADLQVMGEHNISNALAAICASHLAGVSTELMGKALVEFEPVAQRLELVRTVWGVGFYNDSASTTPESTIAGVKSFKPGTVVLIMGGKSKGSDYGAFVSTVLKMAKGVILLDSPLADELMDMLTTAGRLFRQEFLFKVGSMKDAVSKSSDMAMEGDSVVLSPAGDFGGCKVKIMDYLRFRHWVGKL